RHRQRGGLRRDRWRALRTGHGRGAVLRTQLRCDRSRRGCRGPRLRIHDRRPRGRPWPGRPQLRRRHVGWGGIRPRPRPIAGQRRHGGTRAVDQTDETELLELVRRHGEETESSVAAALLADWPDATGRFSKVLPEDFKRVLAARAAAERDGLSDDAVTELMMEAAHG